MKQPKVNRLSREWERRVCLLDNARSMEKTADDLRNESLGYETQAKLNQKMADDLWVRALRENNVIDWKVYPRTGISKIKFPDGKVETYNRRSTAGKRVCTCCARVHTKPPHPLQCDRFVRGRCEKCRSCTSCCRRYGCGKSSGEVVLKGGDNAKG